MVGFLKILSSSSRNVNVDNEAWVKVKPTLIYHKNITYHIRIKCKVFVNALSPNPTTSTGFTVQFINNTYLTKICGIFSYNDTSHTLSQ